jgi:hypothetical protein
VHARDHPRQFAVSRVVGEPGTCKGLWFRSLEHRILHAGLSR